MIVRVTDESRQITINSGSIVNVSQRPDPINFYLDNSILVGSGGVNAFQVVYMASDGTARPADAENPSHAGRVLGLSRTTQAEGLTASIMTAGEIENSNWDLEVGEAYFLGAGGEVTLFPPESGFVQRIGIAKTSKILVINLGEPVLRS